MGNITHTLFKSEAKVRPVTEEYVTQSLPTVASLVVQDGVIAAMVEIMDESGKEVVARMETGFLNAVEPISGYRLYRGLTELPALRKDLVRAMALAIVGAADNINVPGSDESREYLLKSLSPDTFSAILRELPPGLEKMVSDLRESGVYVDPIGLQAEVSAGRLEMGAWLRDLGVDHPEKLKKNLANLRERAAKLTPVLKSLTLGHQSEHCLKDMLSEAVGCYRRGIEKDEHVVALSALRHGEKTLNAHRLFDSLTEILGMQPIFTIHSEDLLQHTCRAVAQRYDLEVRPLADMVRSYRDGWAAMKIVT